MQDINIQFSGSKKNDRDSSLVVNSQLTQVLKLQLFALLWQNIAQ